MMDRASKVAYAIYFCGIALGVVSAIAGEIILTGLAIGVACGAVIEASITEVLEERSRRKP